MYSDSRSSSIRDRLRRLCEEGELCSASPVGDTFAKKPTWCLGSARLSLPTELTAPNSLIKKYYQNFGKGTSKYSLFPSFDSPLALLHKTYSFSSEENICPLKGIAMRRTELTTLLSRLLVCVGLTLAIPSSAQYSINSPEIDRGFDEIKLLIKFACTNVYPRPSDAECIDRVKHGIGASFDPHSEYLNEEETQRFLEDRQGTFGGLGIHVSKPKSTSALLVELVIDDTPSQRAGILAGDIISHITPKGLPSIATTSLKSANDAVKLLRGPPNTPVTISVIRQGVDKPMKFTIVREMIKTVQIKGELLTDGSKTYALIENTQYNSGNKAAMEAKYRELEKRATKAGSKLSGLIISLENNPGGNLDEVYNEIDLFLDAPSLILMRTNERIEEYSTLNGGTRGDITNGLPILVVVNSSSASASEVFAGAMKHFGRATIAGTSRTFGKGIVQSIRPILDNSAIKFTSSEYLIGSPTDWTPVQCIGVEPDILFEYPGIKITYRPTECEFNAHVNTGGPMLNGPIHHPIKEANPVLYKAGESMLEVYKAYKLPKLLVEEEKRKKREAE